MYPINIQNYLQDLALPVKNKRKSDLICYKYLQLHAPKTALDKLSAKQSRDLGIMCTNPGGSLCPIYYEITGPLKFLSSKAMGLENNKNITNQNLFFFREKTLISDSIKTTHRHFSQSFFNIFEY